MAAVPGGVWLDVQNKAGGAGVLFSAEQWAGFASSALALLGDVLPELLAHAGRGASDAPPRCAPGAPAYNHGGAGRT